MFFYIFLFLLITFFSFIISYSKEKNIILLSKIILFLLFFIPSALRKNIGTDYKTYMYMFLDTKQYGFNYLNVEYGYYLLMKFLQIFFDYQSIFIVMSFFTCFFLFKSIIKRKDYIIVIPLFFLLYYTASYNIMRQVFVLSVFLYSYKLFYLEKKKQAYIIILLASLFHYSAVLLFLYYVFCHFLNLKYKDTILFFIIIIICGFVLNIGEIVITLAKFTPYGKYIGTSFIRVTERNSGLGVLLYLLIPVIILLGINTNSKKISNLRVGLLSYGFFWVLANQIMILTRLRIMFMIMFIPSVLELKNQGNKSYYIEIVFLISFLLFVFQLIIGQNGVIPYNSILK